MPTVTQSAAGNPASAISSVAFKVPSNTSHLHNSHKKTQQNLQDRNIRGGRKRGKQEEPVHSHSKSTKGPKSSKFIERRDDFSLPVLSLRYSDPLLQLSADRLVCTGYKGWSSVFATHCAEKGSWYYEAKILENPEPLKFLNYASDSQPKVTSHVRVGWACRYQRYDVPISHSIFGYALRDLDGSVFNAAIPFSYANTRFGVGDVIGCYLCLKEPTWWLVDPRKDRKLYEFLQSGILCNPKEPPTPIPNVGSFIEFSINGKRFGKAFEDIHHGSYHPAVSLYMGARVKVSFGPDFDFPPDTAEDWKPAIELMRPYIP